MAKESLKQDLGYESTSLLYSIKRKRKPASKCRKLAVMVACVMQHTIVYGIGYGLSVMYAELVIVFNALRADAALIQSLNMGMATCAGIFFIGLIRKIGPGASILFGGMFACLGLLVSAFAKGLTLIILSTGVFTGLAISINSLAAFIVVGRMFPDSASFYLIILTTGTSLGQFIYPLLVDVFISQYSWSGAFILISAVSLHFVPSGLIIFFSKEFFEPERDSNQKKSNSICDKTLLKDSVQWIITVNAFLIFGTASMEAWFLVDHMVSRGFARESGTILVSVVGIGSFIGRFVGVLLRYIFSCPTNYHWVYLFVVVAGLHSLIINLIDFWPLVFACFVYGIVFATSGSQLPAITIEASGVDRYPQAIAMVNALGGIGDIIGPLFGGSLRDTFGVYDIAFYTASGLSIYMSAATVVMVCIVRRRKLHSRTESIETGVNYTLLK